MKQQVLTLFAEDSPAKTSPLQDAVRDYLESEADSGGSFIEFCKKLAQAGLLSRMSPASCQTTKDGIWEPCSRRWGSLGIGGPTGCLTANISEWPNDADVCSLSAILEMDVPEKYYLSAKAASGILRRAKKRGKELPTLLGTALQRLCEDSDTDGKGSTTAQIASV